MSTGVLWARFAEMNPAAVPGASKIKAMSAGELRSAIRTLLAPAQVAALERAGLPAPPLDGFEPSPCEDALDVYGVGELRAHLRQLLAAAPPLN